MQLQLQLQLHNELSHVEAQLSLLPHPLRYIMWEAEEQGLEVPYACRMGCCTVCAVRIKEGEMWQPEALGISQGLKEQGYGLMCVGFPMSDCVLETITEDEIYDLQFGRMFEEVATDPNNALVLRDDIALELALGDE
jgi:ferredoxin